MNRLRVSDITALKAFFSDPENKTLLSETSMTGKDYYVQEKLFAAGADLYRKPSLTVIGRDLDNFIKTFEYLEEVQGDFQIISETEQSIVVTGKNRTVGYYIARTLLDNKFFVLKEDETNYAATTIRMLLGNNDQELAENGMITLVQSMNASTVQDAKQVVGTQQEEIHKLAQEMQAIQKCETAQLKKMREELEKVQRDQQAALELLMADAQLRMTVLKKQLIMIEDQIYIIRSYYGDTVELKQLSRGKPAAKDTPLVFYQKMRFLDEELPRLYSIYDVVHNYKEIEEVLKASEGVTGGLMQQLYLKMDSIQIIEINPPHR